MGQKITQSVGTTKSHTLSGQKRNHATSLDKTVTQPLKTKKKLHNLFGPKKSHNLLEQKKIMQSLGGKNQATAPDKKIMQPLGTENLASSGTKKIHTTSQDKKKITLSIGQISSKLVHKAPNWHHICPNWSK